REGILASLAPDELAGLHRRVAEAIERVYPDAPDYWSALAEHWQKAGGETRERHYAIRTGEQQLKVGAYRDAARWLRRVMELTPLQDKQQQAFLSIRLGETHQGISEFEKAKNLYEHGLEAAHNLGSNQLAADALQ